MRRAVEIFSASLGPDHPSTRRVMDNHRVLLAAMRGGDVETLIRETAGDAGAPSPAAARQPRPQGEGRKPGLLAGIARQSG